MQPNSQVMLMYRDGSEQSFMTVYDAVKRPLYAFCLRLAGNGDTAADAVQEAFIRLLRCSLDIAGAGAVKSWLYSTARNQIYNEFRREDRMLEFDETAFETDSTPYTDAERVDQSEYFLKILSGLSFHHREVLMLREYEAFSYDEMAELLGVPESTIKMRLFKARKMFAKCFTENEKTR
jgi:RNA polymerase sigma-70 factor, ECF subfamily